MTSEPARLAEIPLIYTEISARRDENFTYEHSSPVRRDGVKIFKWTSDGFSNGFSWNFQGENFQMDFEDD